MNDNDIEFTLGLDISPAEKQTSLLEAKLQTIEKTLSKIARVPLTNIKATDYFNNRALPVVSGSRSLYKPSPIWGIGGYGALPGYKYAGHSSTYNRFMTSASSGSRINSNGLFWRGDIADAVFKKKPYNPFSGGVVPPTNNGGSGKPPSNEEENQEQKEILDNEKKEGIEQKNSLFLLAKKIAQLYVIKKLIDAIVGTWKKFGQVTTNINANLNQEKGFFSIDPEGALRANVDVTRPRIYAAIRNLGKGSPISTAGMDYTASKITDAMQAALTGKSVDTALAIDTERLREFFGIDLSAKTLLAGNRAGKSATDFQLDIIDKVEAGLGKLANLDEVRKAQVESSMRGLLGDELANALIAHANKQMQLPEGERKSFNQWLLQFGSSAIELGDLTKKTNDAVTALGKFHDSLQILKNNIEKVFSPAFVKATNKLALFADWASAKLNKDKQSAKTALGYDVFPLTPSAITNDKNREYYDFTNQLPSDVRADKADQIRLAEKASDLYNFYAKSEKIDELFSAYIVGHPDFKLAGVQALESLKAKSIMDNVAIMLKTGEGFGKTHNHPIYDILGKYSDKIQLLEDLARTGNTSTFQRLFTDVGNMTDAEIEKAVQNLFYHPMFKNVMRKEFREGGLFDINAEDIISGNVNPYRYLLGNKNDFVLMSGYLEAIKQFYESANRFVGPATFGEGVSGPNEMTITIQLNDQAKSLFTTSVNKESGVFSTAKIK